MFGLGALLALVAWYAARAPQKLQKSRKKAVPEALMARTEAEQT